MTASVATILADAQWWSNIYMSYWVKPPDYWRCQEVNERVNFEIMKRFEAE